jgi:hypothetical protein
VTPGRGAARDVAVAPRSTILARAPRQGSHAVDLLAVGQRISLEGVVKATGSLPTMPPSPNR